MRGFNGFISTFLIVLFWSLAAARPMPAAESAVGSVVALRGEVTATDPTGTRRPLVMKGEIFREDTVRTGERGRIQIMFTDHSIISLGRNSEMKIAEYEWQPEARDGAMKTEIKEGVFRVMGGAITKVAPKKFTTATPAATIGIRGSMYAGKVAGDSLSVVFQGGTGIEIVNDQGTVVITQAGFGTHVSSLFEPPRPPVKFSAAEISNLGIELLNGPADRGEENGAPEGQGREGKERPIMNGEEGGEPGPAEKGEEPPPTWNGEGDQWAEHDKFDGEPGEFPPLDAEGPWHDPHKPPMDNEPFFNPNDNLEPWGGFFSAYSDERGDYTGDFGFMVNLNNREVYGGLPIFVDQAEGENPLGFGFGDGRQEGEWIQVGMFPNQGAGGGRLFSAPPERQSVPDLLWGYWEGNYVDPTYGTVNFLSDFSFWIAGRKTPGDRINELIATRIVGKYEGMAQGIVEDPTGRVSVLQNGESRLNVDFGEKSIFGEIRFDEITFNVSGNDIFGPFDFQGGEGRAETGYFNARIIDTGVAGNPDVVAAIGQVNGMFFGNLGGSLGGNFVAERVDNHYFGIFGGSFENLRNLESTSLQGRFLAVQAPTDPTVSGTGANWYGEMNAKVYQDFVSTELAAVNGAMLNFNFLVPEPDDQAADANLVRVPFQNELQLAELGSPLLVDLQATYADPREFMLMGGEAGYAPVVIDGITMDRPSFATFGFAGIPTLAEAMPTSGIERYKGFSLATLENTGEFNGFDILMSINWQNGKVVGLLEDHEFGELPGSPLNPAEFIFIGEVAGSQLVNVRAFGMITDGIHADPIDIIAPDLQDDWAAEWLEGSADFAQFYGASHQGFGFTAHGTSVVLEEAGAIDQWRMTGAGFRDPYAELGATQGGNSARQGFMVGVSRPVGPGLATLPVAGDYHLLMNERPEDFTFLVNRDTGTIDQGAIRLSMVNGADDPPLQMSMGANGVSAYVDDQTMVAALGGGTVRGMVGTTPFYFAPVGNTGEPEPGEPEYISWGYWGMVYADPAGNSRVTMSETAFWLAGERTPADKIASLVHSGITATYDGVAVGVEISPDGNMIQMPVGQAHLLADFGNRTINGNISFAGHVDFELNGGGIADSGGFSAALTNPNGLTGQANGAMFGPDANVAAGNFNALSPDNRAYSGLFGARRN